MTSENRLKPVLVPARLDWKISSEIPYLKLHPMAEDATVLVTFIGLFPKAQIPTKDVYGAGLTIVEDPGPFRPAPSGLPVRVNGHASKWFA